MTFKTFIKIFISNLFDHESLFILLESDGKFILKDLPSGDFNGAMFLLTDTTRTMAYCQVPKSGSSTLKYIFYHNTSIAERKTIHELFPRYSIRARNIDRLGRLNNLDIFKFMFVRHPFERLASAYNFFFVKSKYREATIKKLNVKSNQEIYMNMTSNDPCLANSSLQFTFSCFVDYVLAEVKNIHWWPYTELCRVCYVQYDLIGYIEDFEDSFQMLLKKFPHNKSLTDPSKQKKKINCSDNCKENKKDTYLKYFHQLTRTTILRLYHKYKNDFEFGDYDLPCKYIAAGINDA